MGTKSEKDIWISRGVARSHNVKVLNYLAFISAKYEVDLEGLFNSIVEAWTQESAVCGNLLIECREKLNDQAGFLITKTGKVVTQFHLPEQLIRDGDILREFEPHIYLHSSSKKKYRTS